MRRPATLAPLLSAVKAAIVATLAFSFAVCGSGVAEDDALPLAVPAGPSARAVAAPEPPPPRGICSPADAPAEGPVAPPYNPPKLDLDATVPVEENLRAWVDLLASPALAGRGAQTFEARRVAALLARQLAAFRWEPALPHGDYCQPFPVGDGLDQNVAARIPGAGAPDSARRVVLLGAHYDHLGTRGGDVYPGADDNASGVAALLEVARVLGRRPRRPAEHRGAPGRPAAGVELVFFGAEERGVVGSTAFVKSLTAEDRIDLMVNLNMVGRPFLEGNPVRYLAGNPDETIGYVVSSRGHDAIGARIEWASSKTGTTVMGIPEVVLLKMGFVSDSVPFGEVAPALFLSTSIHDDYHRPTDTADKIDPAQMRRAAELVLAVLEAPTSP